MSTPIKQVTLKIPTVIYTGILEQAEREKMTISDFLISSAVPNYKKSILTLDQVISAIQKKSSGDIFCLKDLFTASEWENTTDGSHISVGRMFYQAYQDGKYELDKTVKFLKKNSANLAQYQKL